ncbi:helix-turn-helix transcriptional regulator [Solibacillus sp. FSL W7-1436]|uniref:helix-turn-helix domain-containing protein n=1 Tax=Solibacillus sp. FSL W7-1436 TaxID=2921705 RepID=UPI0030F86F65
MEKFISDMLKQRRLEANLSQEQLAARLVGKVDARVIRRIENNEVKNSTYLKQICEVLNISFTEANPDEILSEHRSINKPNVNTGRDLAHLLIHCNHLEYNPNPADQLSEREAWIIEEFVQMIMEMMEVFNFVEQGERQFLIDKFDEEIKSLNKVGFYIYGSCNDTLVNPFKYTELVFVKI